jgi:hypothetical protein
MRVVPFRVGRDTPAWLELRPAAVGPYEAPCVPPDGKLEVANRDEQLGEQAADGVAGVS